VDSVPFSRKELPYPSSTLTFRRQKILRDVLYSTESAKYHKSFFRLWIVGIT